MNARRIGGYGCSATTATIETGNDDAFVTEDEDLEMISNISTC